MKKIVITMLIISTMLLTGCWNKRELDEMAILYGIALEKNKENQNIKATFQVINPNALREKGTGDAPMIQIITAEGKTVFDAVRNNINQFDRKVFFFTNKIIVIDEELAKEGLLKILDLLKRDQETLDTSKIVIAKGVSAKEVLGIKIGIENIQGSYFEDIINGSYKHSIKSTITDVITFYKKFLEAGANPITGVVETFEQKNLPELKADKETSKGIEYKGTAIFKSDKLIGFFDEYETRGLNWVIRKISDAIITFPMSKHNQAEAHKEHLTEEGVVTVEIHSSKGKITPVINGDSFSFNIDVKVEGDVGETTFPIDFTDIEYFKKIQQAMTEAIKKEIILSIKKAQQEFKSDIYGFGVALRRNQPKIWKENKDTWVKEKMWDSEFSKANFTVNVEGTLRDFGLLFKPIEESEKISDK